MESRDPQLAAISAKAIKEARYHLRFSRGWLERLGNGTDVSGQKMQQAIDKLWRFTAELFDADEIDIALSEEGVAVDPRTLRAAWEAEVFAGINEATLNVPHELAYRTGGKKGCIPNILGQCWQKCSISSVSCPVSNGNRGDGYATSGHHCTAAGA